MMYGDQWGDPYFDRKKDKPMTTTEPAADITGMTNEELVDRYRFVIEAIAELYAADAGMYIVERRNLGTELMRRLSQPALDLDALRAAVLERLEYQSVGRANIKASVNAVFDEWGKR